MKRIASLLSVLAAGSMLAGCVVAPIEPAPPVVVRPAPVYTYPAPVYAHRAPIVVQPAPVYVRPAPPPRGWRDRDGDGVPNRYDRRPYDPYRY